MVRTTSKQRDEQPNKNGHTMEAGGRGRTLFKSNQNMELRNFLEGKLT